MWAIIISAAAIISVGAIIAGIFMILRAYGRKAQRAGYASLGDYLRAAPRSEQEKRDSIDLALRGLIICLLGLVFPPFLLIGLVPFYYGARKLAYASMGFGLFEDADPPSA